MYHFRAYYILVEMLNIVGLTWDLPAMFGLHNVRSTQLSVREARQIYLLPLQAYCTLAERYLPYASRGPPGSWHAAVSARAILAYLQVAPSNHEDGTALVSHRRLQHMPSG